MKVIDAQSGFRGYSKKAIEKLDLRDENMGVSAEVLMQGRKKNLVLKEVPISCRYDVENSTQNPVKHGLSVVISKDMV